MNILVTGSYGQLGSEIGVLAKNDRQNRYFFTDIDTLDITSEEMVQNFFVEHSINFVVNCAAYTAVDKAENDELLCYKINRDAVEILAENCKKFGAKIVHISTDYVFDGMVYVPYTEDVAVCPKSIYGKSKSAGEDVLLNILPENAVIIRTAWLYSVFGNNFVKTMLRLGAEKEQINVVFDQIGTPTNAADLAMVIMAIVQSNNFVSGVYHFSNEGVCSWYDFAKAIMEFKKLHCKVLPIVSAQYPVPAPRPHFSVLNKAKIKSIYNIEIPHWYNSLTIMLNNFN
jgi:dTDP-4-dehydrorhamnose reductase